MTETQAILNFLRAIIVAGLAISASPREAGPSTTNLDTATAKELPQSVHDVIASGISSQTTIVELSPNGAVRWSAHAIKLVEIVKARSPVNPDVYLYAMRYEVSVMRDEDSLATSTTTCQAVVVYKDTQFGDPTIACGPIDVSRADRST